MKCKFCDFETDNVSVIGNHYKYKHPKIVNGLKCDICNKTFKTITGLKSHKKPACDKNVLKNNRIKDCPKCGFFIKSNFEKHLNYCDGSGPRRKRIGKGQGWILGKKYDDIYGLERSKEIKNKISKKLIGKITGLSSTESGEIERRNKIRNKINERYKNGWESTAGRCKKYEYNSKIAGNIKVDGSWELGVAKYLDGIGVKWIRNKNRFKYFNSIKNRISTYCPDFFVEDWNSYIEVKGYKTELDVIKWSQFKYNLEVWDKEKLKLLGIDVKYKK